MDIKKFLLIATLLLASCSLSKQDAYDSQQPCRYVENTVELYHVEDDRISGPYVVIDCLQLPDISEWGTPETPGEVVEVIGTNIRHDGVARPADNIVMQDVGWLNVIVQHEQIRPYALNLLIPSMSNVITNPSFEDGQAPWQFHSDADATFTLDEPGYTDTYAAKISVPAEDSNLQLYQTNILLEPITQYRLTFAARSNTGHDLSVYLHQHESPHTNYGLGNYVFDLTSSWQEFSVDFTTTGFDVPISDARLRFWFSPFAVSGDIYWIDDITLSTVEVETPPTVTPTPTATNTLTPTPTHTPTVTPTPIQDILDRLNAIETQQAQTSEQFTVLEQRISILETFVRQIGDLIKSILGE